ncbi:rab GTPase-activating protein 1-like [Oncorhynchus mykiss]|uniref:rab GTPase-activating protein 1-like n=1 Tax=Oncorhynchus mykiss TaxID=8022 RepID=UPI001877785C|nr:rab GTPase-activating protein 1-like [Oncorhynchus mykiss]
MMEEVSIRVAYDTHIIDQMTEEEILACLMAESIPKHTVSSKKATPRENQTQKQDDHVDRYQRENRQLQQDSLRLEQENDVLAHRLITSKISLRTDLDQAEDRVNELTKELLKTRKRLKNAEEEKRGKEEEAAQLKEVLRAKLDKAEPEVKRSSGIISDYKQICSQLTSRVERQQAAHREDLDKLRNAVLACSRCRQALDSLVMEGFGSTAPYQRSISTREPGQQRDQETEPDQQTTGTREQDQEKVCLSDQVTELEKELAQTKLQMVEAKCKIQELEHQKGVLQRDLQTARNSWLSKTVSSIRSAGGGLQSSSLPSGRASAMGRSLHGLPLSAWSSRRLSWAPRKDRGESSDREMEGRGRDSKRTY